MMLLFRIGKIIKKKEMLANILGTKNVSADNMAYN